MGSDPTDEILQRVAGVYAGCASYRDRGEVEVRMSVPALGSQHERTSVLEFGTAFVRPDRLRFEFRAESVVPAAGWSRYVVWQDGGAIRSWYSVEGRVRSFDSVFEALAGPTGVSHGLAYLVPNLFADQGLAVLRKCFGRAEQVTEEVMEDTACLRLKQGELDEHGRRSTVWLDSASLLVRRIEEETVSTPETRERRRQELLAAAETMPTEEQAARLRDAAKSMVSMDGMLRSETVKRYEPELDVEVPAETFAFEPPGE